MVKATLPLWGMWVQSLVRELRSFICTVQPGKKKKSQLEGSSGVRRKVQVTVIYKPSVPVHVVWKH